MTKKRIATMATCVALVGAVAVGGTLALLSQQSNNVTNTFTVGSGYHTNHQDLILDEAKVAQVTSGANLGGYEETAAPRVYTNAYTNLVENAFLDKDPQFHIADDCEVATSWVVAKISGFNSESGKTTLKFTDVDDETEATPENKLVKGTWYKVTKSGTGYTYAPVSLENIGNGIYIYDQGLSAGLRTDDLFQERQGDTFVGGQAPTTITVSGYAVEGVAGVTFDNMKNDVMKTVDTWAFGA